MVRPFLTSGSNSPSSVGLSLFPILLFVLVFLGDGKQFIVDSAAGIGVFLLVIYIRVTVGNLLGPSKLIQISWMMLFIFLVVTMGTSGSVSFSLTSMLRYCLAYLIYILFFNLGKFIDTKSFNTMYVKFFCACVVAAAFVSVTPIVKSALPDMNLISLVFGHNHIAAIFIFTLPIFLGHTQRLRIFYRILMYCIFTALLVLTFARGAFIIALVYVAREIYINMHTNNRAKLTLVLVACVVTALFVYKHPIPRNYFANRSAFISGRFTKETMLENRVFFWEQAVSAIKNNPLIGSGAGTFYLSSLRYQTKPNTYSWYAHSFILEVISESGPVFAVILLTIVILSVWHPYVVVHRNATAELENKYLLDGLFLLLAYSAIEINLNFVVIWLIFWGSLGLLASKHSAGYSSRAGVVTVGFAAVFVLIYYIYSVPIVALIHVLSPPNVPMIVFAPSTSGTIRAIQIRSKEKVSMSRKDVLAVRFFHKNNSEVNLELAYYYRSLGDLDSALDYFIRSYELDPENIRIYKEMISLIDSSQKPDRMVDVIRILLRSVAVKPKPYEQFVLEHWAVLSGCFKSPVLMQMLERSSEDFQAKAFYAAGLCLLKTPHKAEAGQMLKLAAEAKGGWSNMYLDYASFLEAQGRPAYERNHIIDLCIMNQYARDHCAEYRSRPMPLESFTDKQAIF